VLWDRSSPEERLRRIASIQRAFDALPKLPVAPDLPTAAALREGFLEGAKSTFEIERIRLRAVWVGLRTRKDLGDRKGGYAARRSHWCIRF
jgi:hypothetical protein